VVLRRWIAVGRWWGIVVVHGFRAGHPAPARVVRFDAGRRRMPVVGVGRRWRIVSPVVGGCRVVLHSRMVSVVLLHLLVIGGGGIRVCFRVHRWWWQGWRFLLFRRGLGSGCCGKLGTIVVVVGWW